eukprot:6193503-Pleurochrysis_carterae.AAC.1
MTSSSRGVIQWPTAALDPTCRPVPTRANGSCSAAAKLRETHFTNKEYTRSTPAFLLQLFVGEFSVAALRSVRVSEVPVLSQPVGAFVAFDW